MKNRRLRHERTEIIRKAMTEERTCVVCLEPAKDDIVNPCLCKGSMGMHSACLDKSIDGGHTKCLACMTSYKIPMRKQFAKIRANVRECICAHDIEFGAVFMFIFVVFVIGSALFIYRQFEGLKKEQPAPYSPPQCTNIKCPEGTYMTRSCRCVMTREYKHADRELYISNEFDPYTEVFDETIKIKIRIAT